MKDAEERAQRSVGILSKSVEAKQSAYESLVEAAQQYKANKNESALSEAKKVFTAARNHENTKLSDKIEGIKADSGAAVGEKASELLKYDKTAFEGVESYLKAVEKSTTKSAGAEEQQFLSKIKDARNRADSILASI